MRLPKNVQNLVVFREAVMPKKSISDRVSQILCDKKNLQKKINDIRKSLDEINHLLNTDTRGRKKEGK